MSKKVEATTNGYGKAFMEQIASCSSTQKKGSFSIKLVDPAAEQEKATLDDVIVPDYVKKLPERVCGYISEREKEVRRQMNLKAPKGYILYGPPGNGKTLIARAIACEAKAKFISVSGSECMKKYVDQGAQYMEAIFKKAKENAPCIIFIDEIDTVCTNEDSEKTFHIFQRERKPIGSQFLQELDDLNPIEGVTVIAATNRPEELNKKVVRSSHLRGVNIPLPDKSQRKEILGLYTKKVQVASDVNLAELAGKTNGFSGADLKNLVDEAKECTVNRTCKEESEKVEIVMDDFDKALIKQTADRSSQKNIPQ